MRLSVIIPARNEPYLQQTIDDLFAKAHSEIEVIAVLDGYDARLKERSGLIIIQKAQAEGMRPAINSGALVAKGEYLMKIDAHCMVSSGFDLCLLSHCESNWVVVPTRYALDPVRWQIENNRKYPITAHYLEWPWTNRLEPGFHGRVWRERAVARQMVAIDDEMSSQGSCWFMPAEWFKRIGLMEIAGYGIFAQEFQEIGFKTWFSGGHVMVNKNCWYAHWHKTQGRGYPLSKGESQRSAMWVLDHWWNDSGLDQLINRFWPVPGWPSNWRKEAEIYGFH